jgi:hypothetical protein
MEKTSNLVYFKNDSGHAERGALSAGKLPKLWDLPAIWQLQPLKA